MFNRKRGEKHTDIYNLIRLRSIAINQRPYPIINQTRFIVQLKAVLPRDGVDFLARDILLRSYKSHLFITVQ